MLVVAVPSRIATITPPATIAPFAAIASISAAATITSFAAVASVARAATITSGVAAITSVTTRVMPPSAWVDAACNLNGFRDGHDRLLIVNKNHTSNRIVASVKFKPGPSQPCTDGADIDFGAKKPLSPFEVVDGMS